MTTLYKTRELHEAQMSITRQRDEEDQVTQVSSLEGNLMVQRGAVGARKRVEGRTWGIPLTPKYQKELSEWLNKEHEKKMERVKQEYAWKKTICKAVSDGTDVDTIRQLVAQENGDLKVPVSLPGIIGERYCLMTLAAWEGRTDLLSLLLEAGLSVEGTGGKDINPLTSATERRITPLIIAAKRGHISMIEALVDHGADCLARDDGGNTPLHHAAYNGREDCVAVLIPATLAATDNNPHLVTNRPGSTPMHVASLKGYWEVIQQLRKAGWSLYAEDKEGNTVLHTAAWGGSLSLVKTLRKNAGLDPNKKNKNGQTALDIAVQQGHHEVEASILKVKSQGRFRRPTTADSILQLIKTQTDVHMQIYNRYSHLIKVSPSIQDLRNLLKENDPHLVNAKGLTPLHLMAEQGYSGELHILTEEFGHHHTLTYEGKTPLDLACSSKSRFKENEDVIALLERHVCPKIDGTPEELYVKLLTVISMGDDAREVSRLLCAGAPMELTGDFPGSALQQAVTSDRSKIVNLLLASGASITPSSQGFNLLQQAWYSPNTTAKVFVAITMAFLGQLKRDRDRLPGRKTKGLREDLAELIKIVEGNKPWEACWPEEVTRHGKTMDRTTTRMTDFMVTAAKANCPLTVSFLWWAGAWPYFSKPRGTTPLHAAIKAGHLSLVEVMIRDLGASLYIPDTSRCLPKDMKELPTDFLKKLELMSYQREQRRLEALANQQKEESDIKKVEMVQQVHTALFKRYTGEHTQDEHVIKTAGKDALMTASRVGLLQLLYLLTSVAQLPPDTVVDTVCGTTALHEAAAHGKSGCVIHLLLTLQDAAASNAANVVVIDAAATEKSTDTRLNRYSPLQPDRYGQTALHLAAMFGHKHTLELLLQRVEGDPLCRAGNNAQQIHENFTGYLRRYTRYNDEEREKPSPLDHWDANTTLKKLLKATDIGRLPSVAKKANVDFSDECDEARKVKDAVLRAVGILLGQAKCSTSGYMDGRKLTLRLVGSAKDGSKLFAPDEFDINVVVPASECVSVSVQRETDDTLKYKGHALTISVKTKETNLQAECLAEDLYDAVSVALTDCVLDDRRLSVVPPGLTKTQVGVGLALAWQGEQYPLLLVGVDLVPVLEVPWHADIDRPALTPPDISTMHLSATTDGSWRCSFAQLEAHVLENLSPEERNVQLSAKMLLRSLKAEPWMPRKIKSFSTWWSGRSWTVPVPGGFCLKTSVFMVLTEKRKESGTYWRETDTILGVTQIFDKMCYEDINPENQSITILPQKMKAYFGGDCEGIKDATGAPVIAGHLRKYCDRHQRWNQGHYSLVRWCQWMWGWIRWRLVWMWKMMIKTITYFVPKLNASSPAIK